MWPPSVSVTLARAQPQASTQREGTRRAQHSEHGGSSRDGLRLGSTPPSMPRQRVGADARIERRRLAHRVGAERRGAHGALRRLAVQIRLTGNAADRSARRALRDAAVITIAARVAAAPRRIARARRAVARTARTTGGVDGCGRKDAAGRVQALRFRGAGAGTEGRAHAVGRPEAPGDVETALIRELSAARLAGDAGRPTAAAEVIASGRGGASRSVELIARDGRPGAHADVAAG